MTVLPLPTHGRWTQDARGDGRAARVTAHPEAGVVVLSVWRDDSCVGTVRLTGDAVAELVSGLADGLVQLNRSAPAPDSRSVG